MDRHHVTHLERSRGGGAMRIDEMGGSKAGKRCQARGAKLMSAGS
jgi:hypothetical protein